MEDRGAGRGVGTAVSGCVKDPPGGIAGNVAAKLPSRPDQLRAAWFAGSFSLNRFMAPAFADMGRGQSFSLVPGTWLPAQGQVCASRWDGHVTPARGFPTLGDWATRANPQRYKPRCRALRQTACASGNGAVEIPSRAC